VSARAAVFPLALALAASLVASLFLGGCKGKDGSPDAVVRTVWLAAIAGKGEDFRAMYPTEGQLRALFEPAFAQQLLDQIESGAKSVPRKPPKVDVTDIEIEKEADAPAGNGLTKPARLARVKLKIKLPTVEPEGDTMMLVKLGNVWRALPKAASKLLP